MKTGYSLSNYWSVHEGFVYHGHNGGVQGGLTEMAYMPAYGVGYFFSINTGNTNAFERVGKAIRAYITAKLEKPALPPVVSVPPNAAEYAGWYEPDSPRVELSHFLERLGGISGVSFQDGKLLLSSLGGWKEVFLPVTGAQFRYVPKKDVPQPVPTLELLTPNEEGRFIQAGTQTTMKRIPAWLAILEIALTLYVLLCLASVLIYAPFWILGGLSRKRRRPAERSARIWPLVAALSLLSLVGIFMVSSGDLIARMGNLTVWSGGMCAATITFALAAVASAFAAWRMPPEGVRTGVRRYSTMVSVGLLMATAYLAYWGIIGLRTWS
jgi:hypothetical protein